MCVCVCVCVCVKCQDVLCAHAHVHVHVHVCICSQMRMCTHMCTCTYTCMYTCASVRISITYAKTNIHISITYAHTFCGACARTSFPFAQFLFPFCLVSARIMTSLAYTVYALSIRHELPPILTPLPQLLAYTHARCTSDTEFVHQKIHTLQKLEKFETLVFFERNLHTIHAY